MDINSLHRKRQKNVQEQNFLDRELIRQVAEWWEEGNKLPNPIEEKAKVIGIKRETAILVERGVFPECCPNHHYGCFLKREGVFWAFSIVLNQKEDEIIEIARKNKIYVLSDEIYSQYAKTNWKSILNYNYEKSIITQSFSKSHAMTGFRIGYGIASKQIIEKMSKLESLCLTNVSEPIQYVAMKALEADTSINSNTVQKRLDMLAIKAKEMGLEFIIPDGAMYIFARVDKEGFDGVQFANNSLDKGLAVAPGEGFGNYKNFIRISACQDEKALMEGMVILGNIMRET